MNWKRLGISLGVVVGATVFVLTGIFSVVWMIETHVWILVGIMFTAVLSGLVWFVYDNLTELDALKRRIRNG